MPRAYNWCGCSPTLWDMKQCLRFTTLALAAAVFAGCAERPKDLGPAIIIADSLVEKSAASTKLVAGDNVVIRLPTTANSATTWRTAKKPAMDWCVMILSDRIEQQNLTTAKPGEPQWQVFQLRATREGSMTLDFVYDNKFTPDVPPAKTFSLTVEVLRKSL